MELIEREKFLLEKLKKAHGLYRVVDPVRQQKIFDSCHWVFDELVTLTGKERIFFELLLIGGMEFLLMEYGTEEEKAIGAFLEPMTPGEVADLTEMESVGCTQWEKINNRLKPLFYAGQPTVDQLRKRTDRYPIKDTLDKS